ncbi:rhomboid family intramembrane serine protease [Roseospira visakhapatnamensis]|uniref:Membrane associated rhomboid family serine protease n=1 Tax=Roseospira visakhapatnamensis TaxID=390880 RepID=A0A7W6RFX5_9PROT|nr:rhomboid family intramembrane serine protease [Roseospira visakhapatnamensis]MBB4267163.1 membrane associated rhomboid family serine protease [Roseospira visakhapatnamensis]
MLPLRDDNPTTRAPYVTWILIGACVAVFLYQLGLDPLEERRLLVTLGAIPAVLLGQESLPTELAVVPALLTPVTSMFLHGGVMHLGGNLLYLWIFGNNVEDAMGAARFALFYVVCGVAAALMHALMSPSSVVPMVGASGAISGVLGAYLLLFPWARVFVWFGFVFLFWVPAVVVLGLWFGLQALSLLGDPGGATTGVAWGAHLGGFVVGMALTPLLRRPGFPLFSRRRLVRRVSMIPRADQDRGTRRPRGPWGPR